MTTLYFFLNATEKLEHCDVGGRFGHSQTHAYALQFHEGFTATGLLHLLLRLVYEDHPGCLEL